MKKTIAFMLLMVLLLFATVPTFASSVQEISFSQNPTQALDLLPETTANQVDTDKEWGIINDFDFDKTTKKFYFELKYDGTTYKVYDVEIDGDTGFIEKAKRVMYFTEKTSKDRMLYFSFGSKANSVLLTAENPNQAINWEGEAMWNLSKGQVKVVDQAVIYNYIPDIDQDGNVFSYFYMPDVIINELLSVNINLAYQYQKTGFLGLGGVGPVQSRSVTMVSGETNSSNPEWVKHVYQTASVAMVASATVTTLVFAASATAVVPVWGWAITGALGLVAVGAQQAYNHELFAYDIDEIERVTSIDSGLKNSINNFIFSRSGGTQGVDLENNKLYKLHLGQLDKGKDPYILADQSQVMQVVYETNGQINLVTKDYVKDGGYFDGPGTEPNVDLSTSKGFWETYKALIVSILLFLGALKFKVFDNRKHLIIYIAFSVIILFVTGVFRL